MATSIISGHHSLLLAETWCSGPCTTLQCTIAGVNLDTILRRWCLGHSSSLMVRMHWPYNMPWCTIAFGNHCVDPIFGYDVQKWSSTMELHCANGDTPHQWSTLFIVGCNTMVWTSHYTMMHTNSCQPWFYLVQMVTWLPLFIIGLDSEDLVLHDNVQ